MSERSAILAWRAGSVLHLIADELMPTFVVEVKTLLSAAGPFEGGLLLLKLPLLSREIPAQTPLRCCLIMPS